MLNLIRECAPWLNWKIGALFAPSCLWRGSRLAHKQDYSPLSAQLPCSPSRHAWCRASFQSYFFATVSPDHFKIPLLTSCAL
jgi:hypothetical protein